MKEFHSHTIIYYHVLSWNFKSKVYNPQIISRLINQNITVHIIYHSEGDMKETYCQQQKLIDAQNETEVSHRHKNYT